MRLSIFFFLFVILSFNVLAQSRQITGRVLDKSSGKPVANASVIIEGTTTGAVTNHLGFFSLKLESGQRTLSIASIGYVTSNMEVPAVDQFKVILAREYRKMAELDLRFFNAIEIDSLTSTNTPAAALLENEAEYPGGWDLFFNDLGTFLKADSIMGLITAKPSYIRFTVGKDGLVQEVKNKFDSIEVPGPVRNSFLKLKKWRPAMQNKSNTTQFFEIPLRWTTEGDSIEQEVFAVVEDPASPVGGMPAFYKYIGDNLRFPPKARGKVNGRVFVEFMIGEDGSISEVRAVKGLGFGCDEEAVRVVSGAPRWNPGKQKGKPVRQRMVLPITFKSEIVNANAVEELTFNGYLTNTFKYPAQARRTGVEGWVLVRFSVDWQQEKIFNPQILKDIGGGCSEEVASVLMALPHPVVRLLDKKAKVFVLPVGFGLGGAVDRKNLKYIANETELVLEPVQITAVGIERDQRVTPGSLPPGRTPLRITSDPNHFNSFEEALARNKKMTRLSLIHTGQKRIPPIINQFESLIFLDLEGNEIKEIPMELTQLEKLKELYMPINQLTTLPASFTNLSDLGILGLARNDFSEFPQAITALPKLEALDLSENRIATIPDEVRNMKKLKVLFLKDNTITTLPEGFYGLTGLERLHLEGNPLTEQTKERLLKHFRKAEIYFSTLPEDKTVPNEKIVASVGQGPSKQEKGKVENKQRVGVWEFYNDKGELEQKYNYSTRKLEWISPNYKSEYKLGIQTKVNNTFVDEVPDEFPVFIGGQSRMYSIVGRLIQYPAQARRIGVEGKVLIS